MDAGSLVLDAVLDFFRPPDQVPELLRIVTDGYLRGLRSAGHAGLGRDVQLVMAATMAVHYCWVLPGMLRTAAEGRPTMNRRPVAEAMPWWAQSLPHILDAATFARQLAGA
jgi:hypothetical protein